ncbi:MAG: hypothetical protein ACI8P3_003992 [Saprospiraceae bacterium]|jgi:hypothetical protein
MEDHCGYFVLRIRRPEVKSQGDNLFQVRTVLISKLIVTGIRKRYKPFIQFKG